MTRDDTARMLAAVLSVQKGHRVTLTLHDLHRTVGDVVMEAQEGTGTVVIVLRPPIIDGECRVVRR